MFNESGEVLISTRRGFRRFGFGRKFNCFRYFTADYLHELKIFSSERILLPSI
jgi:hypothetical protein